MSKEFSGFNFYKDEHEDRFDPERITAVLQYEQVDPTVVIAFYLERLKEARSENDLVDILTDFYQEVYEFGMRDILVDDIMTKIDFLSNTMPEQLEYDDED